MTSTQALPRRCLYLPLKGTGSTAWGTEMTSSRLPLTPATRMLTVSLRSVSS